mmetsp:Transcript_12449/g.30235  ORF Transcript_12449/g.30235 Transcript_12449/m.30235 type:complete len:223 (+) Transcript_12449:3411-4079(+)
MPAWVELPRSSSRKQVAACPAHCGASTFLSRERQCQILKKFSKRKGVCDGFVVSTLSSKMVCFSCVTPACISNIIRFRVHLGAVSGFAAMSPKFFCGSSCCSMIVSSVGSHLKAEHCFRAGSANFDCNKKPVGAWITTRSFGEMRSGNANVNVKSRTSIIPLRTCTPFASRFTTSGTTAAGVPRRISFVTGFTMNEVTSDSSSALAGSAVSSENDSSFHTYL